MAKGLLRLALLPGALLLFAIVLVVLLFLLKVLWAWTIPDLFPGAVAQGLVAGDISWWTSFKLALFLAFLASFVRGPGGDKKKD